jgi:hypothetical protein
MNKIEEPYLGSAKIIAETKNSLELEIPVRKNWYHILLNLSNIGFWLFLEFFFFGFLLLSTSTEAMLELLVVNVIWFCIGLIFLINIFWQIYGKQILIVNENELKVIKRVLSFYSFKRYKNEFISEFKINVSKPSFLIKKRDSFWFNTGIIKFNYMGSGRKIMLDLDEAEAKLIIKKINSIIRNEDQ